MDVTIGPGRAEQATMVADGAASRESVAEYGRSAPVTADHRATEATQRLHGSGLGPVEWVPQTASTNADLLAVAAEGAAHGLVRVTDHQTAGRGRLDRTWTTRPGDALLVSVLVRPTAGRDDLGWITSASAVAAAEAAAALGSVGVGIKWPNDLVVGAPGSHRKLAGILAQSTITGGDVAVVVGMGLNVRSPGGDLADVAVGLDALGPTPDRVDLLVETLRRLGELLDREAGDEDLWARYRALSATIGTEVRVTFDDGRTLDGSAVDVQPSGALVVESNGARREVLVGEVTSVRWPGSDGPDHGAAPDR